MAQWLLAIFNARRGFNLGMGYILFMWTADSCSVCVHATETIPMIQEFQCGVPFLYNHSCNGDICLKILYLLKILFSDYFYHQHVTISAEAP